MAVIHGACHCGRVSWTFDGMPESATACNCTLCRRYGTLWIYDYENEKIRLSGPTTTYARSDNPEPDLDIHFCAHCGCVAAWRGRAVQPDGRRRMAVNIRLANPDDALHGLPIDHFDGFGAYEDLPRDGRCVRDMWF